MHRRLLLLVAAFAAATALQGCSSWAHNKNVKPAEINPTDMPKGPGLLSGESGNILDAFKTDKGNGETSGGTIGVNIYLWRSALESVAFMPITQADSNGGVITTDWYTSPENPNERVRANVLILGKSLRAEGLKVSLFKQIKNKSGNWEEQSVSPATVRALEDTILTKARALKVQTLSAK